MKKIWQQINGRTWCQKQSRRVRIDGTTIRRCAYAWLADVYPDRSWEKADRLRAIIGIYAIETWNDDPKRTWQEVRAAFKRADL